MDKNVKNIVRQVEQNRRALTNNTQRALLALLTATTEWVPRTALRSIPSVGSRIRDLRKPSFGGFRVKCSTAGQLDRKTSAAGSRQTFYRLDPSSITMNRVQRVFEGVIVTK